MRIIITAKNIYYYHSVNRIRNDPTVTLLEVDTMKAHLHEFSGDPLLLQDEDAQFVRSCDGPDWLTIQREQSGCDKENAAPSSSRKTITPAVEKKRVSFSPEEHVRLFARSSVTSPSIAPMSTEESIVDAPSASLCETPLATTIDTHLQEAEVQKCESDSFQKRDDWLLHRRIKSLVIMIACIVLLLTFVSYRSRGRDIVAQCDCPRIEDFIEKNSVLENKNLELQAKNIQLSEENNRLVVVIDKLQQRMKLNSESENDVSIIERDKIDGNVLKKHLKPKQRRYSDRGNFDPMEGVVFSFTLGRRHLTLTAAHLNSFFKIMESFIKRSANIAQKLGREIKNIFDLIRTKIDHR